MSADWPLVRLGDHIDSSLGKMLDKKKNKGSEQLYLGNSDVRWGYFDLTDLSQMKFEESESERYGIKSGDLIVCEGGEPGRCAVWKEEIADMKIQKALHRVRTKSSLNNYYLYYWFLFAGKRGLLEPYFTGTTIKHLTGKALKELELRLPPLEYQEKVAKVLKSLDDKIEINRHTNQTLEHIAQAIFKSWFVDFEPTRAKIAAKQAGQDPERAAMASISGKPVEALELLQQTSPEQYEQLKTTAALFPYALVDSELGEIPEGWEVSSLKSVTSKIGSGATPRGGKGAYKEKGISQIRSMNIFDGNFSMKDLAKIDEAQATKLKNVVVEENDVLINITGSSVTRCCIVPPSFLPARVNQHVCIVRANGSSMNPYYIYQCFTFPGGKKLLMSLAQAGATREALTKSHIENFEIVVPDVKVLNAYKEQAASLQDKLFRLGEEGYILSKLRDSLLPKLLSGELEVA